MTGELLALVGAVLILISAIGVVRFDDVLARLHALAKASTLGMLLVLAGVAANLRDLNDLTSVVLAGILHLLASTPASTMVSRASYLAEGLPAGSVDERAAMAQPATRSSGTASGKRSRSAEGGRSGRPGDRSGKADGRSGGPGDRSGKADGRSGGAGTRRRRKRPGR